MTPEKQKGVILFEDEEDDARFLLSSEALQQMDLDDEAMADTEDNLDDTLNTLPYEQGQTQPLDLFRSTFDLDLEQAGSDDNDQPIKTEIPTPRISVALAKPISADLDSADEMLVRLREEGNTDTSIAAALVRSGHTQYNSKSIASRYHRLKTAIAMRQDELLEEELTDWHEGEDEALLCAYDASNRVIEHEYEKLKNRRFVYVARHLQDMKPNTNYSAKACKKRYRALLAGTAKIPPELDDDPDKRADEKATRVLNWIEKETQKKNEELEAEERARVQNDARRRKWHTKNLEANRHAEEKATADLHRLEELLNKKKAKLEKIQKSAKARTESIANLNKEGKKKSTAIAEKKLAHRSRITSGQKVVKQGSDAGHVTPSRSAGKEKKKAKVTPKSAALVQDSSSEADEGNKQPGASQGTRATKADSVTGAGRAGRKRASSPTANSGARKVSRTTKGKSHK